MREKNLALPHRSLSSTIARYKYSWTHPWKRDQNPHSQARYLLSQTTRTVSVSSSDSEVLLNISSFAVVLIPYPTIMLNNTILLCFFVFIAGCLSMPANDTEHHEPSSKAVQKEKRGTKVTIDGSLHQVKGSTLMYRQRFQDGQCFVDYEGKLFAEQQVMRIGKKMYRVEDCLFERVFHACGSHLLYILNIVCRLAEQPASVRAVSFNTKRDTAAFDENGKQAPRIISESCCDNLCNISELTRYCHSQWSKNQLSICVKYSPVFW